jgi:hypothetical protein
MLVEFTKTPPDLGPILATGPDVLLLTDIDYDGGLATLGTLRDMLSDLGLTYPHLFAARPNTGLQTDLDIDGDGYRGGPRDAQGYGWFSGQGGMALLSRHPIEMVADHGALLWKDTPDSAIAPDDPAFEVQRLSTSAHLALKVEAPEGAVLLLALAATPPVFDGPEDRNGRRNRDEVLLWAHVLNGKLGSAPERPVVIIGNLNLDPARGNGLHMAVQKVLDHPRLRDPMPGASTVTWDSTGPMRVSYVLPDRAIRTGDSGVTAPAPGLGPHGLVWVDLNLP